MADNTDNTTAVRDPNAEGGTSDSLGMALTGSADHIILSAENGLYAEYKDDWQFYLDAYDGGRQFAKEENIFSHLREHKEDYKERVKRVYNENYCQPLVDFFSDFIFAETIQRSGGSNRDWYNKFVANVNRKGDNASTFMKEVCDDMQIFGSVYVIVDSPKISKPLTKRQERQLGVQPYWILVRPSEILDWVVDEHDNYIYLKRRQFIQDIDHATRAKIKIERYTEYFVDTVVVTEFVFQNGAVTTSSVSTFKNPLGEIPVVHFRFKKSKTNRYMGNSFLRDLAPANREFINLLSLEQEFLYRQCYNLLAMEVETGLPVKDQTEGTEAQVTNVLEVPRGAKYPEYISPDVSTANAIAERMVRIVNYMFRFAAQDTVNELYNGTKASGFSKAESFSKSVPKIASRAETLQDGEIRLMELTCKFVGKEWNGKIAYKDHYEITNLTDKLTQLLQIFRDFVMPSPTFAKYSLKQIVAEYGEVPAADMTKIENEIDEMVDGHFKEWVNQVRQKDLQKQATSPSDQQRNKQAMMDTQSREAVATKQPVDGKPKNATTPGDKQPNIAATKKLKN